MSLLLQNFIVAARRRRYQIPRAYRPTLHSSGKPPLPQQQTMEDGRVEIRLCRRLATSLNAISEDNAIVVERRNRPATAGSERILKRKASPTPRSHDRHRRSDDYARAPIQALTCRHSLRHRLCSDSLAFGFLNRFPSLCHSFD